MQDPVVLALGVLAIVGMLIVVKWILDAVYDLATYRSRKEAIKRAENQYHRYIGALGHLERAVEQAERNT